MAVDTAQKRRSMMAFGRGSYGERVPEATGFDTGVERVQAMFLFLSPEVVASTTRRAINARRRRRTGVLVFLRRRRK